MPSSVYLGGGGGSSLIHQAMMSITHTQLIAMMTSGFSTTYTIVPSVSGRIPVVSAALLVAHFATPYSGIADYDELQVRYRSAVDAMAAAALFDSAEAFSGLSKMMTNESPVGASTPPTITQLPMYGGLDADWGANHATTVAYSVGDYAVELAGSAAGIGGGHADNTLAVVVEFRVYDLASKRFLTTADSGWHEGSRTFS
jgi:hypothetical protein